MLKSDEELLKTFKIELREEGLIYLEFYTAEPEEESNGRQAELVIGEIDKILKAHPGKNFNFFVDLTKTDTITYLSPKARTAYQKLADGSNLNKAAVVGRSLTLEVTINIMMQAAGRGQSFKWFNDRASAMEWLKK
ncbi:MAG TPA: hypothetical protein VLE47_01025 [Candidatus Saccharimonadales bacterium]|nr:hypothetical protein [Candidatus Saccharimonadales bacterium]